MGKWCVVGALLLGAAVARAERPPIRLAVMDFTLAAPGGELDALGVGLQSMITTDLAAVPAFVLVERARLRDIQAELKLGQSAAVDKATAARVGQLAGASHLLVGSFTVVGGKMRIDARLFAVATGQIALGEKIEGAEAAFFDLEKQLVNRLVAAVGVRLSKSEKAVVNKPQTQNLEAFEMYSQALVLADEKKYDQAIAAMEVAVAREPNFALAVSKLAELRRLAPPPAPHEAPVNPTSSSQPSQYWPVTLSLATGALFPGIYYLLNIGKNDARVTTLGGAL